MPYTVIITYTYPLEVVINNLEEWIVILSTHFDIVSSNTRTSEIFASGDLMSRTHTFNGTNIVVTTYVWNSQTTYDSFRVTIPAFVIAAETFMDVAGITRNVSFI